MYFVAWICLVHLVLLQIYMQLFILSNDSSIILFESNVFAMLF